MLPLLLCCSVRKERDEVLDMYLDQPFDEYCITRKELLDLLRRHHNTAIELEKEKEEKQRWVSSLSSTLLVGFFTSTDFRTFWMPRSPSSRGESSQVARDDAILMCDLPLQVQTECAEDVQSLPNCPTIHQFWLLGQSHSLR